MEVHLIAIEIRQNSKVMFKQGSKHTTATDKVY